MLADVQRIGYCRRTMQARFGAVYCPWDHAPEWLDRLVGEAGLDHLTVPLITGPRDQFRPFLSPDSPVFQSAGGWHFHPHAPAYAATGLRPRGARWFGQRDVIGNIAECAARRGTGLWCELAVAAVADLCEQMPALRARGPWGEERPGACFSNPALRACMAAALGDAARFEPVGFVLAIPPSAPPCFCPACLAIADAAGLDAQLISRHAREHRVAAQRRLGAAAPTPPTALADYAAALARDHARSLRHLMQTQPRPVWLRDPAGLVPECTLWPLAPDLTPPPAARAVRTGGWVSSEADWAPPDFVRRIADSTQHGVTHVDFDECAAAPPEYATLIKQAIRLARRA